MSPDQVLRPRVLVVHGDDEFFRRIESQPRQVLHMRRNNEVAGINHQHALAYALAVPIQLVGNITAEHPGADDHDVEGIAAVIAYLLPGAARPATKHVVRELCLLNVGENRLIRV